MIIENNKSLIRFNSFGFDVSAEHYTAVENIADLHDAICWTLEHKKPCLILGGGSNIVFTRNVEGLVIHMALKGVDITEQGKTATVRVAAGENWHKLVEKTLSRGLFGLENLALIPGQAGAAPIQNIGAYGIEVCQRLSSVEVYDTQDRCERTLPAAECDFAYRHSLFKTPAGRRYIVTAINLILSTVDAPDVTYRALIDNLAKKNIVTPSARQVFDTVCDIRTQKLPDPAVIGNAGSFFKNPVIKRQLFDTLKTNYPDLPGFPEDTGRIKVPAAWLIDRAGWKGQRSDRVGVHRAQALVLVNHGGGNGQQIAMLADKIQQDILQRYGVHLEREPMLY